MRPSRRALADRLKPRVHGLQSLPHLFGARTTLLEHAVVLEGVEHGECRRAGDGVAAVGAAEASGRGRVHDVGAADDA